MSSRLIIYTGPNRVDLNLHFGIIFTPGEIPEMIQKAMDADSAFANNFQPISTFRKRPAPGSGAFLKAKLSQSPPARRTLIHPPLRRHR
jgi:hypothetical protein